MEHPRTTKNVGQPCVICGQPANAQATVEASQRVRDEFERERDQLHAALMEAKAALDAERERSKRQAEEAIVVFAKLAQLQALVRAKEDAYEKILLSRERLEREMRGYPPVDNEGIPMVWQEPVGWVKRTLDATTPDSNQLGAINDMVSKGGNGE